MTTIKPVKISEIVFETRDAEIFRIQDTKTKLATIQKYFFPRLELLLRYTLDTIQSIYQVNPYDSMTFVYRPNHRMGAAQNYDFEEVYIGISGKRRLKALTIKNRNGNPFSFHPTYLTYNICPKGSIRVELLPFRYLVDEEFIKTVSQLIQENITLIKPILALNHISYTSANDFIQFENAFSTDTIEKFGVRLFSPSHYFPIDIDRGLNELVISFVGLYPLVEALIAIGEGEKPQLSEMLEQFKNWWITPAPNEPGEIEIARNELSIPELPVLDSYSFIRAGLWWSVLARDNWKCCSCGRSAKEDGITLEVDHIIPRSKSGTNDISNLQTLCKKCNIGKSNKDSTNLR